MTNNDQNRPFGKPLAIITGAAGGMGQACARRLANTHALILTDFNADRLAAISETLRDDDDADIAARVSGDIADDATIKEIVRAASTRQCNVLIHTAGVSPGIAGWEAIVNTNLVGTAKLLDALEPILAPGFVGVVLSSTARCFVPSPGNALTAALADPLATNLIQRIAPLLGNDDASRAESAYAYTKAWVAETVQQRATHWAMKGARIVSLSPGFIRTGMTKREVVERPEMKTLLESTPVGRWGTVNDIANLVEFVLSDKASFITGTDIIVDGGLSARILTQS